MSQQVLDAIGNTPLVELRRVVPPGLARVVAKLESANPTGSMKDRVARAMVDGAAADGRLGPGRRGGAAGRRPSGRVGEGRGAGTFDPRRGARAARSQSQAPRRGRGAGGIRGALGEAFGVASN